MQNANIENKTFGSVTGKIEPESLFFNLTRGKLAFNVNTKDGEVWYETEEPTVVSKFLRFFGINRKELVRQFKDEESTASQINAFVRETITDKNRELVFLVNDKKDLRQVVSKKHVQIPLNDIAEVVKTLAKEQGFHMKGVSDTGETYKIQLMNSATQMMDTNIDIFLGRNDSRGPAGIRIRGSGHIFVCSNQIIAHVDRDVQTNADKLGMDIPKIEAQKLIHTSNLGQRFKEAVLKQMKAAKQFSDVLGKKLTESQYIKMDRKAQEKTLEQIALKHNISKKLLRELKFELIKHDDKEPEYRETLYQLSQVLTGFGTHGGLESSAIQEKLCKLGGQVVLLGKDFTTLMEDWAQRQEKEVDAKVVK